MADDEFYTPLSVVESELQHYDLSEMKVYCPCDAGWSAFYKYFREPGRCKELARSSCDFRYYKAQDIMSRCDVVVTNPPFSLYGKFLDQIKSYDKKFLLICHLTNVDTFIRKLGGGGFWAGGPVKEPFDRPDGSKQSVNTLWVTNLEHDRTPRPLPGYMRYDPYKYEFTDCGVLHVRRIPDIPIDYEGWMAVGESYIKYHDPQVFELADRAIHPSIRGRNIYKRLLIRRKQRLALDPGSNPKTAGSAII